MMGFRYFRPQSLTWWGGALLIATGIMQALGWPAGLIQSASGEPGVLDVMVTVLLALVGAEEAGMQTPAALIGLGAGLIGLRDAQQRHHDQRMGMGPGEAQ